MEQNFIDIGYSTYLETSRIVSVLNPNSEPIKQQIKLAGREGRVFKVTYGRKSESMIVTDNNNFYLSALQPKVIIERINPTDKKTVSKKGR